MITVQFRFERATKNTIRYAELGPEDSHKIGVLYIKKSALKGERHPEPTSITVNITVD